MKRNIMRLFVATLMTSLFLMPYAVNADTQITGLKEAVEEEIELFGKEDSYKEAVEELKNADIADYTEDSSKVNVYMFRGNSCGHCFEAVTFFANIAKEYGKYFNFKSYEVWSNQDNSQLMEDVGAELGDEVSGVPYIVIGKKSWSGFAASMEDEIKSTIKKEYNKEKSKRYDVIKVVKGQGSSKDDSSNDIVSLILIIVSVCAIGFGIVQTRKNAS